MGEKENKISPSALSVVNGKPRGKPGIFADSRFTWGWVSALPCLAALTALVYLLLVQTPEAAERLLSEIPGLISLPVPRLVGSSQTAACGRIQIRARKAKDKSCLTFTAVKVHKERTVVILFHLSHTEVLCIEPGKKGCHVSVDSLWIIQKLRCWVWLSTQRICSMGD